MDAQVKVTNLTGHRFPSGVAFRRAFIEFSVIERRNGRDDILWASGRTNADGVIVDGNGAPLPSELLVPCDVNCNGVKQLYQPHYQTITSTNQVQIYEELHVDVAGNLTTSFIHRDKEIKDNRLLPKGWSKTGPDASIPAEFIEETFPRGDALNDPHGPRRQRNRYCELRGAIATVR